MPPLPPPRTTSRSEYVAERADVLADTIKELLWHYYNDTLTEGLLDRARTRADSWEYERHAHEFQRGV